MKSGKAQSEQVHSVTAESAKLEFGHIKSGRGKSGEVESRSVEHGRVESMLILRPRAERCEERRIMNRIEELGAKKWKGVDLNTLAWGTRAEVCTNLCVHIFICVCVRGAFNICIALAMSRSIAVCMLMLIRNEEEQT